MSDPVAVGEMVQEVYTELHRIAGGYVRRERAQSVQATDLVHEAYLRLARHAPPRWESRSHFIAIAAIAMRRLLVERARARGAAKRGGVQVQVTLHDHLLVDSDRAALIDLIALDRALTDLAAIEPEQARIVEARYFGGLTVEETGDALGISPATVKRHWVIARAWLVRAMTNSPES
ncbi:MAG TPA: ECF-type sigma factor [Vicinamibacterales bacterium]|nr:ECF-type sigma factor [Vicinamibacterales bacterium]